MVVEIVLPLIVMWHTLGMLLIVAGALRFSRVMSYVTGGITFGMICLVWYAFYLGLKDGGITLY